MYTMPNATYVSISEFSQGSTSRIFKELQDKKEIIVLKNNYPVGVISLPKPQLVEVVSFL